MLDHNLGPEVVGRLTGRALRRLRAVSRAWSETAESEARARAARWLAAQVTPDAAMAGATEVTDERLQEVRTFLVASGVGAADLNVACQHPSIIIQYFGGPVVEQVTERWTEARRNVCECIVGDIVGNFEVDGGRVRLDIDGRDCFRDVGVAAPRALHYSRVWAVVEGVDLPCTVRYRKTSLPCNRGLWKHMTTGRYVIVGPILYHNGFASLDLRHPGAAWRLVRMGA